MIVFQVSHVAQQMSPAACQVSQSYPFRPWQRHLVSSAITALVAQIACLILSASSASIWAANIVMFMILTGQSELLRRLLDLHALPTDFTSTHST